MQYQTKPNLKKRIPAALLDYSVFMLATAVYIMLFGSEAEDGEMVVSGLPTLAIPIAWFLYFVVVEAFYGATLGHQALNLKVLNTDRKDIDFTQALKRHLLDPVDMFFYGIPAIIAITKSNKHQRLGDMWADTIVVDIKDPEQYYTPGPYSARNQV